MKLTHRHVRKDYADKKEWTFAEAADYADREFQTIRDWAHKPRQVRDKRGLPKFQYRFKLTRRIGALCVDAASFKEWIRTAVPQGDEA